VGTAATSIYLLHGALGSEQSRESPAVIWTAHFVGGGTYNLSVFEGVSLGAVGQLDDLENWKVAWQQETEEGDRISFGVTKWSIDSDAPLESLTCRAYRGAACVTLAITVVEQPLKRPPEPNGFDEFDEFGELGEP
jgi:hypothetical protein